MEILKRNEHPFSPWVTIVEKEILTPRTSQHEKYHFLAQAEYISILARTESGKIPVVKQFRPSIEVYTYEFPAGLAEKNETLEETCKRELLEEAGLMALKVHHLGTAYADTGRLQNRNHMFFVEASDPVQGFKIEAGISVQYLTLEEVHRFILEGLFDNQPHIGLLYLAQLKNFKIA